MRSLLLLVLLLAFQQATAQSFKPDTIYLAGKRSILAAVLQVSDSTVRYRMKSMPGNTFSEVTLRQVKRVAYAWNTKPSVLGFAKADTSGQLHTDTVVHKVVSVSPVQPDTLLPAPNQLYELGRDDAVKYYRGYESARFWTATSTVVGLVPGLIVMLNVYNRPPKYTNLNIPDGPYRTQPTYIEGYRDEAFYIKQDKVRRTYQRVTITTFLLGAFTGYLLLAL